LEALLAAGAEKVWSVGGQIQELAKMGFEAVPDDYPGQGPLGGVITALRHATAEATESNPKGGLSESSHLRGTEPNPDRCAMLILACDLPWVSKQTLREMLAVLVDPARVVFPVDEQQKIQYLHGLWRLSSYQPLVRAFRGGERSVVGGLKYFEPHSIATCQVSQPQTLADMDELPS